MLQLRHVGLQASDFLVLVYTQKLGWKNKPSSWSHGHVLIVHSTTVLTVIVDEAWADRIDVA